MASFVFVNSANYILTKFADFQIATTKEQGIETYFRHPVFQASAAIAAELVLVNMMVLPIYSLRRNKCLDTEISIFEFFMPAVLDWVDKIFLFIGMS
jgi:NADH:ubiquinone oxidoreductase subunit H